MQARRVVNEVHVFTRTDLERNAKHMAKLFIIGGMYIGDFVDQAVEWLPDGSMKVTTTHVPGEPPCIKSN